jgi:hypothetical protein
MASCYHEGSYVEISWFQGSGKDFVLASKGMFERGMRAKHRLGPVLVTLNGNKAVATLGAIIDIPQEIEGVEMTLSAHCLMPYRVEKRKGVWGLMSFGAIYRRDEFIPAIPGQTVELPSNDLPGEDRPETVKALMEELFGWAGLPVPD